MPLISVCGVDEGYRRKDDNGRLELMPDREWRIFDGSLRQYIKSLTEDEDVEKVEIIAYGDTRWYTKTVYIMIAIYYYSERKTEIEFISR